jgi:capsular polysaccharide biosynthesis protein
VVVETDSGGRFEAFRDVKFPDIPYGTFRGIVGVQGECVTSDNLLIESYSFYYKDSRATHRSLWGIHGPTRVLRVDKPVYALVGKGAYNIGHFLLEVLPKLDLFQQLSRDSSAAIYMPTSNSFHREIAAHLFGTRQVVSATEHPFIESPQVFAAGVPQPYGQIRPWATNFVRELLSDFRGTPVDCPRLLVSRQKASRRRLANWEEVQSWALSKGFRVVNLEDFSFAEQAELFRRAQFVIAPHGAGLANLIFADKKPSVIELLSADVATNPQIWYWALADNLGLPYGALPCGCGANPDSDLTVDMQKLEALWKRMSN